MSAQSQAMSPRSRKRAALGGLLTIACASVAALAPGQAFAQSAAPGKAEPALDFEVYKSRVEPVFLKKREGHTRCVVCHAESNNAFRLEKLPAGAKVWSEEQSRKNFAGVSALVTPGNAVGSRLLLHPLAPERGGHVFHSGGRQFASRNDPDWKALASWVNGAKPGDRPGKK